MILSGLTPLFLFITISVIQVSSFIFVLVALAGLNSPNLYSSSYWALLTIIWFPLCLCKYLNLRFQDQCDNRYAHPKSDFYNLLKSPSIYFGAICFICSLICFPCYLLSRSYDKPASLFTFTTALSALTFLFLHLSAHQHAQLYKKGHRLFYALVVSIQFIAGFLFMLIHIFATIQAIGLAHDALSYPPTGEMISLSDPVSAESRDYRLNVHCLGRKLNDTDPIIWFEHGLGGSGMDFIRVHTQVAKWARACTYDHAGLGYSEIPSYPRTTREIVEDVQILLKRANITDDLLVVGHSMAGYNVRVLQRVLQTSRIVGIVLVDPVDTKDTNWTCTVGDRIENPNPLYVISKDLNTYGATRLASFTNLLPEISNIRKMPDPGAYMAPLFYNQNHITRASEQLFFPSSCGYAKDLVIKYSTPIRSNVSMSNNTTLDAKSSLSSSPSLRLIKTDNTAKDETFANLPYGLVVCGQGVNATNMTRLSTDLTYVFLPNVGHTEVLFDEIQAEKVTQVVRSIWDKVLAKSK